MVEVTRDQITQADRDAENVIYDACERGIGLPGELAAAHRISSLSGVEALVEALEAVRDMQPEPFAYPEDWSDQIKACAECKRYEGHPIQRGICDTHRKPLWARERHDSDEEKRLGYRMKRAIDAALSRFQSDGRDLG